jgi:hypothetical protein
MVALRVRSSVRISSEELVLASDAASWSDDAVADASHLGGFLFSALEVNGRVWSLQHILQIKVISGNLHVVKFKSVSNLSNHSITPYRFCDSGNSVFQVYKLVNYNK